MRVPGSTIARLQMEFLETRNLLTADVELFSDINEGEGSSVEFYTRPVELDGKLYFTADDGIHGVELWVTDGTQAGTRMVKDINEAPDLDPFSQADTAGSFPTGLTIYNGEVYFAATSDDGDELWKSDGTESGTVQVKDIWQGAEGSFPEFLTVFRDELYFLASTAEEGDELWKSNGTQGGTVLVADIVEGEASSTPSRLYAFGDELYFAASDDGESGPELFKSDGTAAGTVLVADINTDFATSGSFPEGFFEFQDELYFLAADGFLESGDLASGLFKTDGTESGTVRVTDEIATVDLFSELNVVEFKEHIYFGGIVDFSWELYRTDGQPGPSELVVDLAGTFPGAPSDLRVLGDEIFFSANTDLGRQIFKTNGEIGEANITEQLTSIENDVFGIEPSDFIVFEESLYFNGHDGVETFQIWRTDGATTEPVSGFETNPNSAFYSLIVPFDGKLFFRGGSMDEGLELWTLEPTNEPPSLTGDVDGNGSVDFADFLILSGNFGMDLSGRANGDLNEDGTVDFADFLLLSGDFGKSVDALFAT